MDTVIREYQAIAAYLLEKHFGLTLNDTNLHDDAVVQELVELNVPVFEAINQLVDKYHLDRIDLNTWSPRSPLLTPSNFLVAVLEIVPEKVQLVCIDERDDKLTRD
ncbi:MULTISPECIES: TA system toxin CbtA family protein [unclassified Serratia (in: enterobacteria)]|uniref:TA system toxin CbtA family protein n=1 Tax=unclassified Serratia (in: enterobacteria) TaxID=2647522 RepID=UPI000468DB2B|nr:MULTISPECIES: TA system toxin CbtA family protein [unclassified Serratia (in: enterobacteria)]